MKVSAHALDRISSRLSQQEISKVLDLASKVASHYGEDVSVAVVLYQLTEHRGEYASTEKSNGNLVVGIIRNGVLNTVFLRGLMQNWHKCQLRTDFLVDATGARLISLMSPKQLTCVRCIKGECKKAK